jgi:hypothetical protein
MSAGISDPTRPDAARELGGLQIIDNRPLAVSLLRPDEFSRLRASIPATANVSVLFMCCPFSLRGPRTRLGMREHLVWIADSDLESGLSGHARLLAFPDQAVPI